jgi:hypothetical protein
LDRPRHPSRSGEENKNRYTCNFPRLTSPFTMPM